MTIIIKCRWLLSFAALPLAFVAQGAQAQFMIEDSAPVAQRAPVAGDPQAKPQPADVRLDSSAAQPSDIGDATVREVVGRVVGGKRAGQVAAVEAVARGALDGDGDVAAVAADAVGAGDMLSVARVLIEKLGKKKPR